MPYGRKESEMKKLITVLLIAVLAVATCVALVACKDDEGNTKFVIKDATDLLQEDFGIALKKGAPAELVNTVNAVIDEWLANDNLTKYTDYYTALDDYEKNGGTAPAAGDLKLAWNLNGTSGKLVMYTESGFAPYEFVGADGKITGVDVAIMSEVAERMGRTLEIKDVAFDFITQYVSESDGYSVGAAGLTINDERKLSVDFSNVYASSTLVIISAEGVEYDSVADLAGKKVGVQQGTSGDLIISDASAEAGYTYEDGDGNNVTVKAAGATVQKYATYALAYQELSSGRIDAILMDKLPAQSLLKTQQG